MGGGNTFLLQRELELSGNLWAIQDQVIKRGVFYVGTSAGTNVACPTICTTNDMPIVQPRTLNALGIVPYQINPHYPEDGSVRIGSSESRDQRIQEFHEHNDIPVIGLREGSWIYYDDGMSELGGPNTASIFLKGREPIEISSGAPIERMIEMV